MSSSDAENRTFTDKVKYRFNDLKEVYDHLYGDNPHFDLNIRILLLCVTYYFRDLKLSKSFHDIQHADPHKQAAYTTKWIAKLKPIQILPSLPTDPGDPSTFQHYYANEKFAILAGLSFLPIDISQLPEDYMSHLARLVRYRGLEDMEWISSYMFLLEKVVNKDWV